MESFYGTRSISAEIDDTRLFLSFEDSLFLFPVKYFIYERSKYELEARTSQMRYTH